MLYAILFGMSDTEKSALKRDFMQSESINPPPPPSGGESALPDLENGIKTVRSALQFAAAGQIPPKPPRRDESEEQDPNRKFGFLATINKYGESILQKYSYLGERGRTMKVDLLRRHPEYEVPPGDPIETPKNEQLKWGFLISGKRGDVEGETYWYRDDDHRKRIIDLMNGVEKED